MRVVPERSPGLQILTTFGGFFVGPFSALKVGALTAPDSELVQTVGVFAFGLAFLAGTLLWMGWGIATVVLGAVRALVRGRPRRPAGATSADRLVPPGYRAYVVVGALAGCAVGLLAGLLTEWTVLSAMGAWGALGTGYGLLLCTAAHHGYLPFPEPE
jgi:hypothetical protein